MRLQFCLAVLALGHSLEAMAQERPLGWLSERYESSRDGAFAYNPGKFKVKDANGDWAKDEAGDLKYVVDKGGPSYGSFQLASKRGVEGSSAAAFVREYYSTDFRIQGAESDSEPRYLDPDGETDLFRNKWAEVAIREGDRFIANEREFIFDTHYEPLVQLVKEKTGLEIDARGDAMRNVGWSVAVQHGNPKVDPSNATGLKVFENALAKWTRKQLAAPRGTTGSVSDEFLIDAVYEERTRRNGNGDLVYFPGQDLHARFKRERGDAQSARSSEPIAPAPDLNETKLGKFAQQIGIRAGPVRRVDANLKVNRGQATFDFSGYDRDFSTTRKPTIPGAYSGVRIGRGYDLGRRTRKEAETDLRAAGLSATQVEAYAGAAGLVGASAKSYLDGLNYSRFSGEAMTLGLKGGDLQRYVSDRIPQTITTAQQRKLFDIAYARAEFETNKIVAGLDPLPDAAKTALLDMVYEQGSTVLVQEKPGLLAAVRSGDWLEAARLSKRKGVGFERNTWTRNQFQLATERPAKP